jgi:predicted lipase
MAITISSNESSKITLKGTNVELNSIYARVSFESPSTGDIIVYKITPYLDKTFYTSNSQVYTNLDITSKVINLQEGETQSVLTAHNYAKTYYEGLGYTVNIVDLE